MEASYTCDEDGGFESAVTSSPRIFVLLVFVILLSSCDQPFDPRGSLGRKLVVFSILSTDRSQVLVRVESDHMPEGYSPVAHTAENSIAGATIVLKSGSLTVQLRDTVLSSEDTSSTAAPFRCYVVNSYTPEYGRSYEVRVSADQYDPVNASVAVPSKPAIGLDPLSSYVLENPTKNRPEADIIFPVTLGLNSKGFIGRLFVDYDVLKSGEWIAERVEIPVSYAYSGTKDLRWLSYGRVTARPSTGCTSDLYINELYSKTLAKVGDIYKSNRLLFNRVVFQVLQMDRNLYNYYVVAHAYNDPHSTRLDEPLYSNIEGGLGVVGAYTLDSLVRVLPKNFFI